MNRLKQKDDQEEERLVGLTLVKEILQQFERVIKKINKKRTGTKRSRSQRSKDKMVALRQELQKTKNELN